MKVLFVGCGNLGSIVAKSVLQCGVSNLDVVLPHGSNDVVKVRSELGCNVYTDIPKHNDYDVIFLVVKPQTLSEILPDYGVWASKSTLIVTIAVGKSLDFYKKYFPNNPVIRVMPNINMKFGAGAAAGIATSNCADAQKQFVQNVFESAGYYAWVEDEGLIDIVAAASGSGPAYYFLFSEYLINTAVKFGLNKDVAEKLVAATLHGAGVMAKNSDNNLEELRSLVTSKKGTTEQALRVFKEGDLEGLIFKAFGAAVARAKELNE
jgi:pyrroline-5-carboxylate reductase